MEINSSQASEFILNLSIVKRIVLHSSTSDLLNFRFVNSQWKREADRVLRQSFSLKKLVNLKLSESIVKFTRTFTPKSLLHNSFVFHPPNEEDDDDETIYEFPDDFLCLVGSTAKFANLTHLDYSNDLPLYEEILFDKFPNLVVLEVTDEIHPFDDPTSIFSSVEDRQTSFGKHVLDSLKMLKCFVVFDNYPSRDDCYVLSREIIKIAPNLLEVKVEIDKRAGDVQPIVLFMMNSIANCGQKVESLMILSVADSIFIGLDEKLLEDCKLDKLRLKRFVIIENSYTNHKADDRKLAQIFNTFKPIWSTLEEIRLNFDNFKSEDFEKNQIEKIEHSPFPIRTNSPIPWLNLKKLNLRNCFCWGTIEYLTRINYFVQNMTPNLREMEVVFDFLGHYNRMAHILVYPFFVWMGNKVTKLTKFSITNVKLKWEKGEKENYLGIESIDELSDEKGKFTMAKVQKLDLSLLFSLDDFLNFDTEDDQMIFLQFLKHRLPIPLINVGKAIAESSTDFVKVDNVTRHNVTMERLLVAFYSTYAENVNFDDSLLDLSNCELPEGFGELKELNEFLGSIGILPDDECRGEIYDALYDLDELI